MTWKNGFGKCYLIYQPMDEKTGPPFQVSMLRLHKSPKKKLLGLFLREEFCLISSSSLYKSILCMVKRTN